MPPLVFGSSGNSFPCGHCSIAFVFSAFYLLWRRRHPVWAWGMLSGSTVLGLSIGMSRMAAGGHFLSDVLWSAVLTWMVLLVLYWLVMKIPWREDDSEQYLVSRDTDATKLVKLALVGAATAGMLYFVWLLY